MRSLTRLVPLALAFACGGEDIVVFVPETIEKVAGADAQTAPAGGFLANPLAVIARTADGSAARRALVRWTVMSGTGALLSDSTTAADGNGRAEVAVRLGTTPGPYAVRAQLVAKPDRTVDFAATAVAPPALSGINPTSFGGGDTIGVSGTGLDTTVTVDIAGVPTRRIGGNGATTTSVVAPVCLAPGSVSVRARAGVAASNELSGTYTAPAASAPVRLAVGDYAAVDPSRVAGCVVLPPATGDTAEYLVGPQATSGVPGFPMSYRLRGDSAGIVLARGAVQRETPFGLAFHDALREAEAGFARQPRPPLMESPPGAPVVAQLSVGDHRQFRVCNKLKCNALEDFTAVDAEARYVGEHAAIYQDVAAPSGFTTAHFDSLGAVFDDQLYDVGTQAFGAESDVDQNGRVLILFTPVVNKLTPASQCSQSFVTGFFFSIDIDPAFAKDERSNHGEVFYAIVPDSAQTVTCRHTVSSVLRIVPVTFVHEFQHMISYFQHVVLRAGQAEDLWLNEAMSHLAEELGAFRFLSLGSQRAFSDFAVGNLLNAFNYLKDSEAWPVLFDTSPGTLEERGASWLFLRWVVDQFGDDVIRRLSETRLTGQENVAAATGEPVSRLLTDWFLANYVSDLPGFTAPARLRYGRWRFRTTFADLNRQAPSTFDRSFPIVPVVFIGGAFDVSGILRSGSGPYFRVRIPPGQRGTALQLTRAPSGELSGVEARLNLIRVR
ncbi:MAG: hypothetical protein HY337_10555 [Gemmatimonadetes bacterium]|nr:hypothetical protein [Gemmatimonadota bacterium]